jgi:hypothetical protein
LSPELASRHLSNHKPKGRKPFLHQTNSNRNLGRASASPIKDNFLLQRLFPPAHRSNTSQTFTLQLCSTVSFCLRFSYHIPIFWCSLLIATTGIYETRRSHRQVATWLCLIFPPRHPASHHGRASKHGNGTLYPHERLLTVASRETAEDLHPKQQASRPVWPRTKRKDQR